VTTARVIAVDRERPDPAVIEDAARIVRAGGLVAFATETLYGLGVDPWNTEALRRLFLAKGRADEKGVPVLVADFESVSRVAASMPPAAEVLAARHWPGALTLVLPARPELSPLVAPDGVAVRWTSSVIAARLARAAGGAITATSANRSGDPIAPLDPARILAELGSQIDLLLDSGVLPASLPSTLVDARTEPIRILRQGSLHL